MGNTLRKMNHGSLYQHLYLGLLLAYSVMYYMYMYMYAVQLEENRDSVCVYLDHNDYIQVIHT